MPFFNPCLHFHSKLVLCLETNLTQKITMSPFLAKNLHHHWRYLIRIAGNIEFWTIAWIWKTVPNALYNRSSLLFLRISKILISSRSPPFLLSPADGWCTDAACLITALSWSRRQFLMGTCFLFLWSKLRMDDSIFLDSPSLFTVINNLYVISLYTLDCSLRAASHPPCHHLSHEAWNGLSIAKQASFIVFLK